MGGDIHRGAFSGTFMRGFFSMAKRRVTTHSKVASAACTRVCVFARALRRAHPGALPLSAPTWAARGVFSASCFVSERALPRAAEVLPEAVGAHPRFCVSAAKERAGAFREERSGRKRGGLLSAWVCHGHVGGCLHAHTDSHKHTDVATVTTIPVHTRLPARSK